MPSFFTRIDLGHAFGIAGEAQFGGRLADPRARSSYLDIVTDYAEQNSVSRLAAIDRQPKVPVRLMARAFAGAHLAILEAWLDGEVDGSPEDVARMQLDLVIAGMAWAHNLDLAALGYTIDPPRATPRPPQHGRTSRPARRAVPKSGRG